MQKLIWSDKAKEDYSRNIDYLLSEWNANDAQEFVDKSTKVIEIISKMPLSFPPSDYAKIRKAIICKQISLLYEVKRTEIILHRFWNNSQNPEKLNF